MLPNRISLSTYIAAPDCHRFQLDLSTLRGLG